MEPVNLVGGVSAERRNAVPIFLSHFGTFFRSELKFVKQLVHSYKWQNIMVPMQKPFSFSKSSVHLICITCQCHENHRSLCHCVCIRVKMLSHVINIIVLEGYSDVNCCLSFLDKISILHWKVTASCMWTIDCKRLVWMHTSLLL